MTRSELKAQVLVDLETDSEVFIPRKYIHIIWGYEQHLAAWCESWNLHYAFFQSQNPEMHWLEITRPKTPADLNLTAPEERTIIDETDARL